jgi:hypothetical protein
MTVSPRADDATMATMTSPYLDHVPVLTGVIAGRRYAGFCERIFIGHWPADTTMERISRVPGGVPCNAIEADYVPQWKHPGGITERRPTTCVTGSG